MARITALTNGPLLVDGEDAHVLDANGTEYKIAKRPFALCRCGESGNRPFCDGTHARRQFQSTETAPTDEM